MRIAMKEFSDLKVVKEKSNFSQKFLPSHDIFLQNLTKLPQMWKKFNKKVYTQSEEKSSEVVQ